MNDILIVDDHPIVRQGLAQLVGQEPDLRVCGEAANGAEALRGVADHQPDIAIVDLSLGSEDGIALIERLHGMYPDLRILVLSMHAEGTYAERCLKAGAKGYVMKQAPPQNVIKAIRKIIAGGLYLSEELGDRLLRRMASSEPRVYASPVETLSNREFTVFRLLGSGQRTREIAETLNLSVKTIETHIERIKKKMDLRDSREVIVQAVHWLKDTDSVRQ